MYMSSYVVSTAIYATDKSNLNTHSNMRCFIAVLALCAVSANAQVSKCAGGHVNKVVDTARNEYQNIAEYISENAGESDALNEVLSQYSNVIDELVTSIQTKVQTTTATTIRSVGADVVHKVTLASRKISKISTDIMSSPFGVENPEIAGDISAAFNDFNDMIISSAADIPRNFLKCIGVYN